MQMGCAKYISLGASPRSDEEKSRTALDCSPSVRPGPGSPLSVGPIFLVSTPFLLNSQIQRVAYSFKSQSEST